MTLSYLPKHAGIYDARLEQPADLPVVLNSPVADIVNPKGIASLSGYSEGLDSRQPP